MAINEIDDLLESFKIESLESLQTAEEIFLKIEKEGGVAKHFDVLFRLFHSLKGGTAMFEMKDLQTTFHALENKLTRYKTADSIPAGDMVIFLKGIDYCRGLFEGTKGEIPAGLFADESKQVVPESGKSVADASNLASKVSVEAVSVSSHLEKITFTVCIIDDEDELLDLMRILLEEAGFVVHTFNRPKAAIEAVVDIKPDVILCDMAMPEMTGLVFHKNLLEKGVTTPLIFISGHLNKSLLIDVVNQGADGVIEKPFDNDFVVAMATGSARKHRMTQMIDRTVNFLLYQYSDFDDYLRQSGKHEIRKVVESEMSSLIAQRKFLRDLMKEHRLKVMGKK